MLQGDELRSVLENMPQLAEALAKELGTSIGQMRKLGSEGKLTADLVFPALIRAAEKVGGELDKAPASLSRAFGQLSSATGFFLGQLDQAIGLSNGLARALSGAAGVIDRIRRGSGLLTGAERLADIKAEAAAIAKQIETLEAGIDTTRNNGTLRPPLTDQVRQKRLAELRAQYQELIAEIRKQELAAGESQREEQAEADGRAAEARRQRATTQVEELRKQLDARYKIEQEFAERARTLREAESRGAITAAERTRLETLALQEKNDALQKLEPRIARARQSNTDAEQAVREQARATNAILAERETLIEANETAEQRYLRGVERLLELVEKAQAIGSPIPVETIDRALQKLDEGYAKAGEGAKALGEESGKANDAVRELGLTFSSAFEDAIVKGEKLSKVMQGILSDIARIIARKTITEPLTESVSSAVKGFSFGDMFSSAGSWLSGLFRAEGGPVSAGQPYIVGERGPEWFVPGRSGTVLPNGTAPGGGTTIQQSISIDARGAEAGVEARLRLLANQIARQSSLMTLDAIRRGGTAYRTVKG